MYSYILSPSTVLLLPDDHLPVVGTRGQDVAVHGVSPGHLPHRTLMAAEREEIEADSKMTVWIQHFTGNGERR